MKTPCWIWQYDEWPHFCWNNDCIIASLARVDGSPRRFYSMSAAILRDIQDFVDKGILCRTEEEGRSTNYRLVE